MVDEIGGSLLNTIVRDPENQGSYEHEKKGNEAMNFSENSVSLSSKKNSLILNRAPNCDEAIHFAK